MAASSRQPVRGPRDAPHEGLRLSALSVVTPALATVVILTVLGLGVICWVINSPERSDRVNRMMFARQYSCPGNTIGDGSSPGS